MVSSEKPKRAVVFFNLGGPDKPSAVEPFLFNLFNDPAIIGAPGPIRWLIAKIISKRRAPIAQEIYAHLGGGSPLLPQTQEQADALEAALNGGDKASEWDNRVFICMRYWHPMSAETAAAVKAFDPDEIVLLPLYPQFSTTTTGSSLKDWQQAAASVGLDVPTRTVCCYPTEPAFISAQRDIVREGIATALEQSGGVPRVLFSAHGLPKKVIEGGDPYQWQVEQTAAAVVQELRPDKEEKSAPAFDWVVCYQSRVGPLEWIGPSTEDELARAAVDGVPVVVVPIAFVSEHSETLVELDIEYRELAEKAGVPAYVRVPAVRTIPAYIESLAGLVDDASTGGRNCTPKGGDRLCPADWTGCPYRG